MGLKEWFELGKFLLFGFFFGFASWIIGMAILGAKPSRQHLFRHLAALVMSCVLVWLWFRSNLEANAVFWMGGIYWLITAIPAIPRIRFDKEGVVASSALALAKVVLFVSVVIFTTTPPWIDGVLLAPWALVLAMRGLQGKDKPVGPQIRPITES